MSRKNKLRTNEISKFPNVLEFPEEIKAKWDENYFKNKNPIILELACGKGEYTIALSEIYPDKNFIGIDAKGPRIWVGAKQALDKKLSNVAFLRIFIERISEYFEKDEVSEIWITFPDPYPKPSKSKKRLISERFLIEYAKILKKGGMIHFKTDNLELFRFGLETINRTGHELMDFSYDLYNSKLLNPVTTIQTNYEKKFLRAGKSIKYLVFKLKSNNK